jgi:hypothetical protein
MSDTHLIVTTQSKDQLCQEQETMMREWMIAQIDDKYKDVFESVNKPWDKTEVLMAFFNTIKFKDIVLIPEAYGRRNKVRYVPWYSITTLTSLVGGRVDALRIKLLKSFDFMTITDLELKYQSPLKVGTAQIIVPLHLKDNNYDRRLFVNSLAALTLVRHTAYKPSPVLLNGNDIRPVAKELLATLDSLDTIVVDIIDDMNDLIAEYKQQQQAQQLISLENDKKKQAEQLAAIEADKQKMEDQKRRLEEETKALALRKFPDIIVEKSHYGYIFSSPDYMAHNLYKIGITDNLTNRERDAKTYNPDGSFLHTVESYDSRSTELTMHIALKKYGLWHEISAGNEWFYVPSLEEAKKLLDIATNNTAMLYDHIALYASTLRNGFSIDIKQLPTQRLAIMDAPSIESLITDYVNEVVQHIIDSKATSISKTNMIQLLRKVAHGPKYRKKKDQLPTDLDTFLTNRITGTHGINMSKKQTKSTIKIEIAMINDTNTNAAMA